MRQQTPKRAEKALSLISLIPFFFKTPPKEVQYRVQVQGTDTRPLHTSLMPPVDLCSTAIAEAFPVVRGYNAPEPEPVLDFRHPTT